MTQQCLPVNQKMQKIRKVLQDARETQNRELDLVDKAISSFDDLTGIRKYCLWQLCVYMWRFLMDFVQIWAKQVTHSIVSAIADVTKIIKIYGNFTCYGWTIHTNEILRNVLSHNAWIFFENSCISLKKDTKILNPRNKNGVCTTHTHTHIRDIIWMKIWFFVVNMTFLTRITLSHNKLSVLPPGVANLVNLEILNLSNNHLEELPLSLSSMPKLRILNCSINRLNSLPRGFGAFPVLEVLDLSYNNLNEHTLPGNFFMMETLRALYLGDNDFEFIPPEVKNLKNLQIVRKIWKN